MALALGESLKFGKKQALPVPFALLIANLFIAPLMLVTLALGNQIDGFIAIIPYFGSALLVFMGIQEWRNATNIQLDTSTSPFIKAIGIDLLSPFGYLMWLTVLGPSALQAWFETGIYGLLPFYLCFMGGAVSSLIFLVIFADVIRPFLQSEHVAHILKFLALLLIVFGLKLLI